MRVKIFAGVVLAVCVTLAQGRVYAGEVDILISKLVEKGILSPSEAQIILDETKLQVTKELSQQQAYSAPEWTQKIKMSGDVRFRTQGDWGKANSSAPASLQEQRWRNRVRGRFGLEAKVNDFVYAGTRIAGGGANPRSTNDTLDGYWEKDSVMFDQYWMRFEVPAEFARKYSMYFNDIKLWGGKFPIPFEYSELVWDSDINPTGVALQYASPDLITNVLPSFNLYSNMAMLWLNESGAINTDPILWALQVGAKTDYFGPMDSQLNVSTALYNFANIQSKTPGTYSSGTNSRWWIGDINTTKAGSSLLGTWKYEYMVIDLLMQMDNNRFLDWEFPYGFYGDFIYNAGCHEDNTNKGYLAGAYIGKKKLKAPGDWKLRGEWRYIGRDAIPDFMPDSDFYGFGTYTSSTSEPFTNGIPAEGGTNSKGINLAFEYQLFKNTSLNFEYYWMKPIKSFDKRDPWNELQMDVVVKF